MSKIVIYELDHCGPKCPHYWIWSNGPCCSFGPGERKLIPEEFDNKKGFPEFCKLEDLKKENDK